MSPINAIIGSAVMQGEGGGAAMMGGGAGAAAGGGESGDFDMFGGIDPEMDPELAMAIRVSTEEARAEEEARVRATQEVGCGAVLSNGNLLHCTNRLLPRPRRRAGSPGRGRLGLRTRRRRTRRR